jgi:hypothetical protein
MKRRIDCLGRVRHSSKESIKVPMARAENGRRNEKNFKDVVKPMAMPAMAQGRLDLSMRQMWYG